MAVNFSENKLLKNILKTGIISACLCLVLFLCAYLFLGKVQFSSFSLSGSLLTLGTALVLSALWLSCYWLLDSLKPEPVQNVVSAFFAGFLVQFALQFIFNRFLISSFFSAGSLRFLFAVKDAFIAGLSFYASFWLFVGRLKEFDEQVDNLIYGGFCGTGIAAAICLNQFFTIPSLNLQFVVVSLLTRIALCSSVCALAGILCAHSNKIWQSFLSALVIPAIYYLESLIHLCLRKNLAVSQHKIQELLVPLLFVLVLFAVIVFIILKTAEKNKDRTDFEVPLNRIGFTAAMLCILTIALTCTIQQDSSRGIKVSSEKSNITMKIPSSFEKSKQNLSLESLFDNSKKNKEFYTKKRTEYSDQISLAIDFNPYVPENFSLQELPFSPVNGCQIFELPKNPASANFGAGRDFSPEEMRKEGGNAFGKDGRNKDIKSLSGKEMDPASKRAFSDRLGEKGAFGGQFNGQGAGQSGEKQPDYVVILKKGDVTVALEFNTSRQNRPYVNNVIKMVAKSLSVKEGR